MAEEKVQIEKGEVSKEQMQEIMTGEFITVKELAEKLRFSYPWVIWHLQEGRIKGIKPLGGRWRIPRSEYDRVMKEGTPPMTKEKVRPPVTEILVDNKVVEKIKEPPKKEGKPPGNFPLDFSSLFGWKK